MLKKIISFLAWVGILILSIVGINFVLFPYKYIFSISILSRLSIFELKIIILTISVIYLFIIFYKFISLFERNREYEKNTENGIIKISYTTINNYIIDLLKRDSDITNIKVNTERKGKKVGIHIKIQILSQVNVTEKISEIQNKVKESLNTNIGVDVKEVIVNISGLSAQESTK